MCCLFCPSGYVTLKLLVVLAVEKFAERACFFWQLYRNEQSRCLYNKENPAQEPNIMNDNEIMGRKAPPFLIVGGRVFDYGVDERDGRQLAIRAGAAFAVRSEICTRELQ
jgi:hypothetical protein